MCRFRLQYESLDYQWIDKHNNLIANEESDDWKYLDETFHRR